MQGRSCRGDHAKGLGMGDKAVIRRAIAAAAGVAIGCHLFAAPAAAQSLSDRFKSLFGGKPDEQAPASPTEATGESDLTCPPVTVRAGASTFAVALPGKQAVGNDLRYQASSPRRHASAPSMPARSPPASASRAAS